MCDLVPSSTLPHKQTYYPITPAVSSSPKPGFGPGHTADSPDATNAPNVPNTTSTVPQIPFSLPQQMSKKGSPVTSCSLSPLPPVYFSQCSTTNNSNSIARDTSADSVLNNSDSSHDDESRIYKATDILSDMNLLPQLPLPTGTDLGSTDQPSKVKSKLRPLQHRALKLPPQPTSFNDASQMPSHLKSKTPNRPLPELSDLILALNLDADFESFFSSLVDILDQVFLATRVSISIPNDPTDIISVPWALKAIWNKHFPLSASRDPAFSAPSPDQIFSASDFFPYASNSTPLDDNDTWVDDDDTAETVRDSPAQFVPRLKDQPAETHTIPSSFSSVPYNTTDATLGSESWPHVSSSSDISISPLASTSTTPPPSFRQKFSLTRKLSRSKLKRIPSLTRRSPKSSLPSELPPATEPPLQYTKSRTSPESRNQFLDSGDASYNVDSRPTSLHSPLQHNRHMLIFDKFSSLAYERDPLIDVQGVVYALERNKPVLLQRRYQSSPFANSSCNNTDFPGYFDSEQTINSPWSVSPAPSPAIRDLHGDNFFPAIYSQPDSPAARTKEMEAAFDASDSDTDDQQADGVDFLPQSPKKPVFAIGCENTTSILHIPLIVPTRTPFALDDQQMTFQDTTAPIAILSIMSPLIPYPLDLKDFLKQLTPHIAAAFLKASIHSSISAQLEASTKAYGNSKHRRHGSSIHSFRSRGASTSSTSGPASPDKRPSFDLNSIDAGVQPKKQHKKFAFRRHHRVPSNSKNMLQSHGASFIPDTEPPSHKYSPSPASPTSSSLIHGNASSSNYYHWRRASHGFERAVPSSRLLRTIIDAIPIQVFTLEPVSGDITWVSNRTLAYRGQTAEEFFHNPFDSIHPDEREAFVASWTEALGKGEPFGCVIRMRRFDGRYRAAFTRMVPLRDDKGVITHWLCSMMDVHKQRKAELEELRRARETASDHKYKILADVTPVIVFTVHPEKGVVYANNSWFNYSGCSKEETYGFQYLNRIHPDDRKDCLRLGTVRPVGPLPTRVEARLLDKNNEYNWHLITSTSIDGDDSKEEPSLWFGTCTNINDQKLIQKKLQEAKDAAQRTIESKTRFLSNMSHEIRTPLIGISGMVSFLLDTKLSEEQLDYCHTISSSSDALLMVINDILDLSKVESGKMTLNKSWFHVRRLVEEANEFLSSMAISKPLELNYIVESDVPMWVKGDRIRLRQVMLNVIGNAIKFTSVGEVFTRCSVIREESGIMLKFEVIDTGQGFTAEDEHRMFKPFSQLKYLPHQTHSSGTGLGLVISRQLIQLHGGTLTCNGKKDKGSTFVFTCKVQLPSETDGPSLEDQNKAANVSASEVSSVGTNNDLDILIICPYKYAAESIVHHICKTVADPSKCKCIVVKDGSSLDASSHNWTHVIINVVNVDDAIVDANRVLRLNKICNRSIEIVMLSTPLQRPLILKGIEKEFQESAKITVLYKPLKPSRYSLVFDPSMEREESQDMKMQIAQKVLENQKDIFKSIGTFAKNKQHRVLLAEDNLINQKVMGKFFVKSGLDCDIACDGEDCVSRVFANGPGYYDLIFVSYTLFLVYLFFTNMFFFCSVIWICLERTGSKHAKTYEGGNKATDANRFQ